MQPFLCFPVPVQVLPFSGRVLIGTGSLSHVGLLQTGPTRYVALTYRHASPDWIGRCTLGLPFTHGFIFSELPEKPANLPHLKTC